MKLFAEYNPFLDFLYGNKTSKEQINIEDV